MEPADNASTDDVLMYLTSAPAAFNRTFLRYTRLERFDVLDEMLQQLVANRLDPNPIFHLLDYIIENIDSTVPYEMIFRRYPRYNYKEYVLRKILPLGNRTLTIQYLYKIMTIGSDNHYETLLEAVRENDTNKVVTLIEASLNNYRNSYHFPDNFLDTLVLQNKVEIIDALVGKNLIPRSELARACPSTQEFILTRARKVCQERSAQLIESITSKSVV